MTACDLNTQRIPHMSRDLTCMWCEILRNLSETTWQLLPSIYDCIHARAPKVNTATSLRKYFSTVPYDLGEVHDLLRDKPVPDAQYT